MVLIPNAQEYQEAMQNPGFAFEDPELRASTPYVNKFLMPISSAGGFAIVFKMKGGGRDWAVRCFTRSASDQESRYAEITRYLKQRNLPYTVSFDYIKRGVRVNGAWHPILKMEWANGQRLDEYICSNLHQPKVLSDLSQSWLKMSADLKKAGIAHGDLQHGNVLVCNGQLKLVDYDAMYVPSLKGRASNETGHRNYQHPQRGPQHFEMYVDNFSLWVIYLALVGLSVEPSLWMRKTGDESVLLGQGDYKSPVNSQLLNYLRAHTDSRVRTAAAKLADMLAMPLERLPELGAEGSAILLPRVGNLPGWLHAATTSAPQPLKCPRCRSELVRKTNRPLNMHFLECSSTPRCQYRVADTEGVQQNQDTRSESSGSFVSQPKPPNVGAPIDECQQCGMVMRLVYGDQPFYVCENYPACNFTQRC